MPYVEAAEVGAEAEHVCCEAGEAVVSEVEGGEVRAGGEPGGRQVAQQVVGEGEAVQARQPWGKHRHYNQAASCSIPLLSIFLGLENGIHYAAVP